MSPSTVDETVAEKGAESAKKGVGVDSPKFSFLDHMEPDDKSSCPAPKDSIAHEKQKEQSDAQDSTSVEGTIFAILLN
jgi:hypothetical protein